MEGSRDPQEVADAIRTVVKEAQRAVRAFEPLARRAPDPNALRRYIRTSREQSVLLKRAADQYDQGDTESAAAIVESGQETAAQLRGIAQGYGFKVCGSPRDG